VQLVFAVIASIALIAEPLKLRSYSVAKRPQGQPRQPGHAHLRLRESARVTKGRVLPHSRIPSSIGLAGGVGVASKHPPRTQRDISVPPVAVPAAETKRVGINRIPEGDHSIACLAQVTPLLTAGGIQSFGVVRYLACSVG
jgi:hypothetical protein